VVPIGVEESIQLSKLNDTRPGGCATPRREGRLYQASHYFYEVFNGFVSVFNFLLLGKDVPRMSD
jgi:hypothetical protein